MVAKVLPTLMIAVLFVFFNADIWKVAYKLTYTRMWEVCAVLLILAGLVSITSIHDKTKHMLGGRTGENSKNTAPNSTKRQRRNTAHYGQKPTSEEEM